MRALAKMAAGPGLELVDVPEPRCGPTDVLIRVLRTGICGTDLHLADWDDWAASVVRPPLVLGHEFFGEVVAWAARSRRAPSATASRGEGHIVCGTCRNCRAGRAHVCINTEELGVNRDGAFADFVVIPSSNVWVQPADIDPDLGALFDPLGNATHTTLQWPLVGEDVVITGAGPIGIMAAATARHAGARFVVVSNISDHRLDLARLAGVDVGVNPRTSSLATAQQALGMKDGFDIGLGISGAPAAFSALIENMNHGGRAPCSDFPRNLSAPTGAR